MTHAHPPGACAGLPGSKAVLGSWFRSRHVVRFLEGSQRLGIIPWELGVTPCKPGSSLQPSKLDCCWSLGWEGARGAAVRFLQSLQHLHSRLGPQHLFAARSLGLAAPRSSGGVCLASRDAVLAPEHLRLPGLGLWVWDRHGHIVDRQGSWMSWRGSDADASPSGLEGLLWGGAQGSRSRSPGTGRLSPQPCALPRAGFPRQAAHETSLVSNCCAPPFIIIDSASP